MDGKIVEEVARSPAVAVEKVIETTETLIGQTKLGQPLKKARDYWRQLGPGLTTGAADDDPSGIATYSQAGAGYGFQLLWLAWFTFPLMATVQEMCARLGLATGRGLAANIKHHFSPTLLYICSTLLIVANTFNIGADLGAMAKVTQLLLPNLPFTLALAFFTGFSLAIQIFVPYQRYAGYLKWLAITLLVYVAAAFLIEDLNWRQILAEVAIPTFQLSADQLLLMTAIFGTTISPYLFFWQTSQEVEEEISEGKTTILSRQHDLDARHIRSMRTDIWSGMFFSNLVMFFIILTAAATLNRHGLTTVATAAEAAEALRPIAGDQAYLLFSLGIIGTGLLAVPILAGSASYALSESFNWRTGMNRRLKSASAFYGTIITATLLGFLINFSGLDPIKALVYAAVANGAISPLILGLIVRLSGDPKVMGRWTNRPLTTAIGWLIVGLMTTIAVSALISIKLG